MAQPKSYKGLKSQYDDLDEDVRNFLSKLGPLLDDGKNYEIALAYCFMKLEEGHHRALKCGLVRIHECASTTVDHELQKQHFTAEKYRSVFNPDYSPRSVGGCGMRVIQCCLWAKARASRSRYRVL